MKSRHTHTHNKTFDYDLHDWIGIAHTYACIFGESLLRGMWRKGMRLMVIPRHVFCLEKAHVRNGRTGGGHEQDAEMLS